jgi:hypothetical protein
MSAEIVAYYDFDEQSVVTCHTCGWSGPAGSGDIEYYADLFDVSCPTCETMLLIVGHPTHDETRAAAARGDPRALEELVFVERRESFLRRFDQQKLRSPEQLPDITGGRLDFLWDAATRDGEEVTVLRLEENELWVEPRLWEGVDRFYEVKELLRQRYGERFASLTPTEASETWLYGDTASSAVSID